MNKLKFRWARHFILITILLEWSGFIIISRVFKLSVSLPISQVSSVVSPAKWWAFIVMLLAAISYSIAGLYFNNFYNKSLITSVIAGIFFSLVPLLPYDDPKWAWLHLVSALSCFSLYVYLIFTSSKSELLGPKLRRFFKIIYLVEIIFILGIIVLYNSKPHLVLALEVLMTIGIHLWASVLYFYRKS